MMLIQSWFLGFKCNFSWKLGRVLGLKTLWEICVIYLKKNNNIYLPSKYVFDTFVID